MFHEELDHLRVIGGVFVLESSLNDLIHHRNLHVKQFSFLVIQNVIKGKRCYLKTIVEEVIPNVLSHQI